MIKEILSIEEFKKLTENKDCIVDFSATWCGPCQMLHPVLEEISNENEYTIYSVDVDLLNELASFYSINVVPTLLFFKNNKIINKLTGYRDYKTLKEIIQTVYK